jgi:hypothetical protein
MKQTIALIIVIITLTVLLLPLNSNSSAQTQGQTDINLKLVSQIGGEITAMSIDGNYAYIGEGPRLTILDITNPATPTFVGRSPALPSTVSDIYVKGSHAYIANGDSIASDRYYHS